MVKVQPRLKGQRLKRLIEFVGADFAAKCTNYKLRATYFVELFHSQVIST